MYKNKFNLINKEIIIIGGFGLIGFETVKGLLELGAKVLILDNIFDKKKFELLKYDYKERLNFKKFDLTKNKGKEFKKILKSQSILINCSYPKNKFWNKNNFSQMNEITLTESLKKNLVPSINTSIIFAEYLKSKKKAGSIIQLSSIYGLVAQNLNVYKDTKIKENNGYSLIKSSLHHFSKQMCSYYSKNNIRINSVCPGGVLSKKDKNQSKKFLENYKKIVPIKRLAEPNEIASCIIFLSMDASSYITGSTLIVDGGWTSI